MMYLSVVKGMLWRLMTVFSVALALSACGGDNSSTNGNTSNSKPAPSLVDVKISSTIKEVGSDKVKVPLGENIRFEAIAVYSDKSTKTVSSAVVWTSSDEVIKFQQGANNSTADAIKIGATEIRASYKGVVSKALSVEVTAARLLSIELNHVRKAVSVGGSYLIEAWGVYSDKSKRDISQLVTWSSSDAQLAMVKNTAGKSQLHAFKVGKVNIQAFFNGVYSTEENITVHDLLLTQIQVTEKVTKLQPVPSVSVSSPVGLSTYFQAIGTYDDGSTEDLSERVQWIVDNNSYAQFDAKVAGKLDAKKVGVTTLHAKMTSSHGVLKSNEATLNVTNAVISQLQLSATSLTLPKGNKLSIDVQGIFSDSSSKDLTEKVQWSSSDSSVAVVIARELHAKNAGITNIRAEYQGVSAQLTFTISPAELVKVVVSALQSSIALGEKLNLKAQGVFTDGSTLDISNDAAWFTSNSTIATVHQGELLSKSKGIVKVRAKKDEVVSNDFEVEVTAAKLMSLVVTPKSPKVAYGNTLQLKAEGIYSDKSRVDLTNKVAWSSAESSIATISASGLIATKTTGSVSIYANYRGKSASQYLEILAAKLERIAIKQQNIVLRRAIPETIRLKIVGYYSDGTESDVTNLASWQNPAGNIISVSTVGSVWPHSKGISKIHATVNDLKASTEVSVSDTEITGISLSPDKLTLVKNDGLILKAVVTFDDGSEVDLSTNTQFAKNIVWDNDNKSVAYLYWLSLFGLDEGKANLRANYKSNVTGVIHSSNTIMLDVKNAPLCGGKVNDRSMNNASGACLKVIEKGTKQYTSTPSKAFIDLLRGYRIGQNDDEDTARRYHSVYNENGNFGPVGSFISFRNDTKSSSNRTSEFQNFCFHLAKLGFNGRTNWRTMNLTELAILAKVGDLFRDYGWPTSNSYWTNVRFDPASEQKHHALAFVQGAYYQTQSLSTHGHYASCTSDH